MAHRSEFSFGGLEGCTLLVVGGAGYIGSCVALLALSSTRKCRVRVLDTLMYGGTSLFPFYTFDEGRFEYVSGDVRTVDFEALLDGVDYVFNAAALVGEHICKKYPREALEINQQATIALAQACAKSKSVKRYIFASTCSNYGKTTEFVDEGSAVDPLSLYAATKINVEQYLMNELADFPCTVLRFATIYGLAARVRFDLLVHEFIRDGWIDGNISIYGPGGWRPFLHVADAARAVLQVCDRHDVVMTKRIFNVGSNEQNFQKETLGRIIQERLGCKVELVRKKQDPRSYRVNFKRIRDELDFKCTHTLQKSVDDICTALEGGLVSIKELHESVNVKMSDPIRNVPTGAGLKYAATSKL